jgi:predicted dehydrogenase
MARRVHVPSLKELPGVEIVAVCDLVEERARTLARERDIPDVYVLHREMLEKESLDAVFVLVEPASLYHVVRHCLDAGKHVFMEKPAGISAFQAASLARQAEAAGKILQVGFNRRYVPLIRHVVGILRERTTITQVDGRFMKNGTGAFDDGSLNAFTSDTVHCVDLLRWLTRSEPEEMATVRASYEEPHENAWNALVRFQNGATGTVRANYRIGGRIHSFEIHGPGATAMIDLGLGGFGCRATLLFGNDREGYSLSSRGSGRPEIVELDGMEIAGSDEFPRYYGFFQEDEDFIRCVREADTPDADIKDAARTMGFVEALLKASLGQPKSLRRDP